MTAEPLRLDPATAAGRRLTAAAIVASMASGNTEPTLKIHCARCGSALGYADYTAAGPLFISSWEVERALDFDVIVNGRTLSRREALRYRERKHPLVGQSGRPITETGRDGVFALLVLPPGIPEDFPDLLVRCADHGDAVLTPSRDDRRAPSPDAERACPGLVPAPDVRAARFLVAASGQRTGVPLPRDPTDRTRGIASGSVSVVLPSPGTEKQATARREP